MTRIYDNIKAPLGEHLQKTLQQFDRMDVAVGYFNLRGWSVFDGLVAEKGPQPDGLVTVRILIGMVVAADQDAAIAELQAELEGSQQVDADGPTARERKTELVEHLRQQLMRGAPTPADRRTLASLRSLLANGTVEIKVFTSRPLHGKTYIFYRDDLNNPITGFVGSSNLTVPGLSRNYELNVDVLDGAAAADLSQWFQDRWDDPFSRPVTDEILALIDESWAAPAPRTPYDVFLKVCYDLSRDVREGLAEYSIPPEVSGMLLDYQATAVKTLARRIMARGGSALGDVVGLGKTLVGIAVALMLRDEHGFQTLVVCPKNLVPMWEEHMVAFGLHGRVVPYSQVHAVLPSLRRYAFAIVDEAHAMRNDTRRDYAVLRDYLRDNDTRVLLLTATPYNIQFRDVANQLQLYIDESADLGLAPTNALAADPSIRDKVDGKITTLAAFKLSEDPDDWKRLMSEHLVRRTRSFIRRNFAQPGHDGRDQLTFPDGHTFTFPERVAVPIQHSFGPDDPAALMASNKTLDTIRGLHLPRYDLVRYLDAQVARTPEEVDWTVDLARGRGHVAGFVRTGFFKRLSSCGYSFEISLLRHIARNKLFAYSVRQGLLVPTGTILDVDLEDEEDPERDVLTAIDAIGNDPARAYAALQTSSPTGITWVRPELFTPALLAHLDEDAAALRELLDWYGPWTTANDSKLAALVDLLTKEHRRDKVLVFTEYKDTAEYIARALSGMGVPGVGVATGDSTDPTELARRFSPLTNMLPAALAGPVPSAPIEPEDELRVLIATDVLSEGQNLQQSHVVANYDLPWAIIRLIQRAGRVDRLGQTADTVYVYSFFHQSVDQVISLRRRIADRLKANAAAFGSDEAFFGTDGETLMLQDLYAGKLDDTEADDDVDASSLAYQYWQQATKDDPGLAERIARLPDLLVATRIRRVTDGSDGVACFVRTESDLDGFAFATSDDDIRLMTGQEALRTFAAEPDEAGQDLLAGHDDLVLAMVRGPLSTPQDTAGRLRGVRRTIWRRLGSQLRTDPGIQAALDDLYQNPLTGEAERRLRLAMRQGATDDELAARIAALHRDDMLVGRRSGADPIRIMSTMGIRS